MASPNAVRGPAMRTAVSSSNCRVASRSWVKGTWTNAALPNTIRPTRSPSRRVRKSSSTSFTAVNRSTFIPLELVKSSASIEPERSTNSIRSRVGRTRLTGGSSSWGRASASVISTQSTQKKKSSDFFASAIAAPSDGCWCNNVAIRWNHGTRTAWRDSR